MEGALNGLRLFCSGYAQTNPGEKTVGVLITDGQPNGCDEAPNNLAGIAAAMSGGDPSVPLFTIGMDGADFGFLDQVAAAGGTQRPSASRSRSLAFAAATSAT